MLSLIGRYHIGRKIEDETKVNIRNSSQDRKDLSADAKSSRVLPVLAISRVKAALDINLSREVLSKGYILLGFCTFYHCLLLIISLCLLTGFFLGGGGCKMLDRDFFIFLLFTNI